MGQWELTDPNIKQFIDDGNTTLTNVDKDFPESVRVLYQGIFNLLNESKLNAFHELKAWRKYGKQMLGYMRTVERGVKSMSKEIKRYKNNDNDRSGKKWTPAEDEMLIQLICDDDYNLLDVSRTLGRSVAAISTRCSYLVGVERKEQIIVGKFQGKLNGICCPAMVTSIADFVRLLVPMPHLWLWLDGWRIEYIC